MISHSEIPASSADPNAVAAAAVVYSKTVGGVTQLFSRSSDGTITQVSPSPAAVNIAFSAPPAAVNLTTLGTIDWIAFLADFFAARPTAQTTAAKATGLWLLHSFETLGSTNVAASHNNSSVAGVTFSCTAIDNVGGGAFSASLYYTLFAAAGTQTNFGFVFKIPASATQRVLRIYTTNFLSTMQVTASLSKSGATDTDSVVIPGAQTNTLTTITFNGNEADELIVTIRCSNAANGSIAIGGVALGVV